MSRLDRMAPVKEIPQIGAAIGRLHIRIAEALEERFPEAVESEPEQLARHYTEAGLAERANSYWLKAGQRATERSANVEAIAHLISGLDLLESLPDTAERLQQELRLQMALSAPLIATKGYGAPETARAVARAEKLCEKLGDVEQWFTVLYGQWAHTIVRAEHQSARQLAGTVCRSHQVAPEN
jgi:predicted ATPase